MHLGFRELKARVIDRGLCTACGACVGVCPRKCLDISYNNLGDPEVVEKSPCNPCGICYGICPGEEIPLLELDQFTFGKQRTPAFGDIGHFLSAGWGFAADETIRKAGASGGLATALLAFALEKGMIDCAIVATYTHLLPGIAQPAIAVSKADLIAGAQSKHAAVPTNAVLQEAVQRGYKKIAVVGLPCHIHAIRKIQQRNTPGKIAKAITLCIGIFCGSQNHYEGTRHFLAEWFGIENLSDVQSLEYSAGWPESSMVVRLKDGSRLTAPRRDALSLYISLFRRERCAMCIDFAADLADISIGRYWGEAGTPEDRRRSSFLLRSIKGENLLKQAVQEGAIVAGELDISGIRASRGYETKRHGSAFRLLRRQEYGWPTPNYHLRPDPSPSSDRKRQQLRMQAISQDRKGPGSIKLENKN